ncbi:MAG TPA: radical SAM protein, partial [Kofleriaceae bacterium]|nr:radical SAM protein [Kofleriaceae bacterium]
MTQATWNARERARELLAGEVGTVHKDAPRQVALVYPSPYRAAMSSLGYQAIYGLLNDIPDVAADRAMLPEDPAAHRAAGGPLLTLERERPVGDYPVIAFSVAYELEIAGMIECLELAGVAPLARDRRGGPLIVAGGPLTFSNPVPLAPFVDVIIMGEGEELIVELIDLAASHPGDPEAVRTAVAGRPGFYVPLYDGDDMPPVAAAANERLPARSRIITANTELASMFMTEAARGCSRGCTYCVMRRTTNGGMRIVAPAEVLAGIPTH